MEKTKKAASLLLLRVRGGWLLASYLDLAAADHMRAAALAKVDAGGFVKGVCAAAEFDSPGISAEGQAFFLMMEASHSRLVGSEQKE